ncbi:hypothetical protein AMAG_08730 [Allomyces macrogynus ATCC 38327]|uniref:Uncharacterized protein n=1 Tax=Allomyces macrogynus (strain ATCC 38327) TaxID=578462 RepID=A0A0L0SM76_ALLM3|nr:hypothetical protein AMAG_08730 [Allomyces macrogynus ATCC 38327]|eukprot:KNE63627.1 hypothetical protein AMAG_08730 [Allomyces macrogynus ATCC 38327]
MATSTRHRTLAMLALILITLTAATGKAPAEIDVTPVTKLNEWTAFPFYAGHDSNAFSVTLGPGGGMVVVTAVGCLGSQFKVSVNDGPFEVMSPPAAAACSKTDGITDNPQTAFNDARYSRGTFKLPPGAVTFKINLEAGSSKSGGFFKITGNPYIDPALVLLGGPKVITASGKVATRADAVKACAEQGMELAGVSTANWADMANVLRTSTAVSFTPTDAVIIGTWNGDSYGDANLQLNLRKDAATGAITNSGITLVSAPRYPLCAPPKAVPLPIPPTVLQRSGDVAVVGPAGKAQDAESACTTALGADFAPAILGGARADEFKTAATLAFNAAGANQQVWIAGWEEASNKPLALATGSAAGVGSVVEPEDIQGNKLYLCTKKVSSGNVRRSEL